MVPEHTQFNNPYKTAWTRPEHSVYCNPYNGPWTRSLNTVCFVTPTRLPEMGSWNGMFCNPYIVAISRPEMGGNRDSCFPVFDIFTQH